MRVKKDRMTKIESLLFIYGMPYSYIAEVYSDEKHTEDPRKYKLLVNGEFQRIDKDVLTNICNFLNVSTDLVLDGLYDCMDGRVFIENCEKWITFDQYILFRSIGIVLDILAVGDDGRKYIRHYFRVNDYVEGLDLRNDSYMDIFIKYLKTSRRIIYSAGVANVIHYDSCCKNEDKYEDIIKPYFLKYLREDEFEERLEVYRKIKISRYMAKASKNKK